MSWNPADRQAIAERATGRSVDDRVRVHERLPASHRRFANRTGTVTGLTVAMGHPTVFVRFDDGETAGFLGTELAPLD